MDTFTQTYAQTQPVAQASVRRVLFATSRQEVWKPIDGFESAYEVSSRGRVRSLDRMVRAGRGQALLPGRVLKQRIDRDGYCDVSIRCRGVQKQLSVHRLVALHFLPATNLPEVNHRDLDKANNKLSNLEWVSRQQNVDHAVSAGLYTAVTNPRKAQKLTAQSATAIIAARRAGATYSSLASWFGVCRSTARKVAVGKIWAGVEMLNA